MERLLSCGCNIQSVPESYVFPPEKRPGNLVFPVDRTIPVVDLGGKDGCDHMKIIQQISKACQEFGFFQVINHGILGKTIEDMLSVAKEFFEMSPEYRASLYSEDPNQPCRVITSKGYNYNNEEYHYWRDNLRHPCHPPEDWMHFWPEKPTRYREVVRTYSVEVRKLGLRLLEIIGEGLGLGFGYFSEELSQNQLLFINHYPPCPDPSLTLGLPKHSDPNIITLLLQGNEDGLQIFKDGQWIVVEPLPNAFVVNVGLQLQIISNGRLRSAEHRAVTNSSIARTSAVILLSPTMNHIIEPTPPLVNASNPPLYKAFQYKDFLSIFISKEGDTEATLELFKLQF